MNITASDVIDLLPIVAGNGWAVVNRSGWIRDRDNRCPLCALANAVYPDLQLRIADALARDALGIGKTAADHFVYAADGDQGPLRDAMLVALGDRAMKTEFPRRCLPPQRIPRRAETSDPLTYASALERRRPRGTWADADGSRWARWGGLVLLCLVLLLIGGT